MADQDARIDLGIRGLGPAEHIGRGGFADVYRAEQRSLRRTVAVKVLRAQASDAETEARFERECHAIGAVSDHPHIVGVHEGGFTDNGRAYLVMEYLPGGSLSERIERTGPLPGSDVVEITIKIGRALAEAHRAGILHRDLKPANIMISAYEEPALGDFGIARIEGGHRTATGLVTASFAHAAPEVLEGQPPSVAADIYSLGSTMYELLVGHGPFYDARDESVWPLMKRILSEPIPAPASVGMGTLLGHAFRRATARHPVDRYRNAEEFVADLEEAAANPPVTVEPTGGPLADRLPGAGPITSVSAAGGSVTTAGAPSPDLGISSGGGGVWPAGSQKSSADPGSPTTPLGQLGVGAPPAAALPDLLLPAQDKPVSPDQSQPWAELFEPSPATRPMTPTAEGHTEPTATRSRSLVLGTVVAVLGGLGILAIAGLWLLSNLGADSPRFSASITGAADGPFTAGEQLQLAVAETPPGAMLRAVVDGVANGTPATELGPVTISAGRHSVAVEVTTVDGVQLTDPIVVYAIAPSQPPGYRANLASVSVDGDGWPATLEVFDQLVADGHEELQILRSDESAGQTPGYWNLFVPGFGEDPAAVETYCEDSGLAIPGQCFAGYYDPNA